MSEGSLIGWLDMPGHRPMTLNYCVGCKPRSDGCEFCFAPKWVARQQHLPGRGGIVGPDPAGRLVWTGKVIVFRNRLARLRSKKIPHMVFVTALGELFDPQVTDDDLHALWQTMADTPQHTYVILTKLAKRMHDKVTALSAEFGTLPNVWLGVSCENQEQANIRIPWLLRTPAATRAVSCEPLLGPIDLRSIAFRGDTDYLLDPLYRRYRRPGNPPTDGRGTTAFGSGLADFGGLHWVIVGGEAANRDDARPMHPAWARAILRQADAAPGVAAFFKQWGTWAPAPWVVRVPDDVLNDPARLEAAKDTARAIGATHGYAEWAHLYDHQLQELGHACYGGERKELEPGSPHVGMRFFPGKSAGHTLDGRTWRQWPTLTGQIIHAPDDQKESAHA